MMASSMLLGCGRGALRLFARFPPLLLPPCLSSSTFPSIPPHQPQRNVVTLSLPTSQHVALPPPPPPSPASLAAMDIQLMQSKILIDRRDLIVVEPRDVDEILDMYIKQGKIYADPYWCRVWPSSILLAEEILMNPQLVANLQVCDLGSGLGVTGLAAALAGAREVVFFDQEPLALLCSLLSVHANIAKVVTNLHEIMHLICPDLPLGHHDFLVSPLWKFASSLSMLSDHLDQNGTLTTGGKGDSAISSVRAELLDWSDQEVQVGNFDVVLACDVLYDKDSPSFLSKLIPRLVHSRDLAKVLITDPTHRTPKNREELLTLFQNLRNQGLKLEKMETRIKEVDGISHSMELMLFS